MKNVEDRSEREEVIQGVCVKEYQEEENVKKGMAQQDILSKDR